MNVLKYKVKIPLARKMMFVIANEPIHLSNGDILFIKKQLKNSISGLKHFLSEPIEVDKHLTHNFKIEKKENEKDEEESLSSSKSDKSMNKKSRKKRKALNNGSN